MQHVFVHLAQKLVQLFCVLAELGTLLSQQVLDTLAVDRPVNERHLRNRVTAWTKVFRNVLAVHLWRLNFEFDIFNVKFGENSAKRIINMGLSAMSTLPLALFFLSDDVSKVE
jgi:hypothetical protein